ncbi:MAG: DUF3455 domain-containing protein [Hyphomicrobiaceae bacterium]
MRFSFCGPVGFSILLSAWVASGKAQERAPREIYGPDLVVRLHAEGAQVYQCKAADDGARAWRLLEPLATLFENGRVVGRHYAGPTWELNDGSAVTAKVAARAPGARRQDVPLLWLEVISQQGAGQLSQTATIERLNTKGGMASGPCAKAGATLSVPYSADYTFLRRPD